MGCVCMCGLVFTVSCYIGLLYWRINVLIIAARRSWVFPQRVRADPGCQALFGEFQAKNLASSSNDIQVLFRK